MAALYFPKKKNLTPFTLEQRKLVWDAVELLSSQNLPNDWCSNLSGIQFFSDSGMTVDNGIMGYTSYLRSNEILIAHYLVANLSWNTSGVPNNEAPMSVIVHELTHTAQRKWLFGLIWPVLNIPGVDLFTLEKWAMENQEASEEILQKRYSEMRRI